MMRTHYKNKDESHYFHTPEIEITEISKDTALKLIALGKQYDQRGKGWDAVSHFTYYFQNVDKSKIQSILEGD